MAQANPDIDDVDDGGGGGPYALQITLVLRQVLSNLSDTDLLRCSLVNKRWNYESRSILRDLRKCYALINDARSKPVGVGCPCLVLRKFNYELAHSPSSVMPFNGIAITIRNFNQCYNGCNCEDEEDHFDGQFEPNFTLRHLKVHLDFHRTPTDWEFASRIQPLIRLIVHNAETIEEITFATISRSVRLDKLTELMPQEDFLLPNLRCIRFPRGHGFHLLPLKFLNDLLGRSPNLTELYLKFSAMALDVLSDRKLRIVKDYEFFPYLDLRWNEKFAQVRPKLSCLAAWAPGVSHPNAMQAWETLKQLLESSRSTLEFLKTDSVVLLWFLGQNFRPFWGLKTLELGVHVGTFEDTGVWQMLPKFDLESVFPNLESVSVNELIRPRIEFDSLGPPNPDSEDHRLISVKNLKIEHCFSALAVPMLAKMFPGVSSLEISTSRTLIYEQIWSQWEELKVLKITQVVDYPGFNLDTALCGIASAELKELGQMSVKQLEELSIVPVRHSLVTVKHLRTLVITLLLRDLDEGQISDYFLISPMSAILIRQKMPKLTVRIRCDNDYVVSQLRGLVSTTLLESASGHSNWTVVLNS